VDGYDPQALHVLGMQDGLLVAYARCFPAGVKFAEASIGRVATRMQARGTGLGHFLIDEAVRCVVHAWGPQAIRIGAQARLEKYYTGHGFANVNRPYIEDGIDHLEMVRHP
jgi:ElaA protein